MKKQIVCLFAAAALLGVGCDDKIPEIGTMDVPATGIVLDEELRDGVLLEVGRTLDVSWRVTVEPADATDLAEMFYSSNVEVATVSPKGLVTAHRSGITMISIYVAGYEAYFPVRVVDQVPVDIESLAFAEPTMECYAGVGYTLFVSTQPLDQNEGVVYTSSDPSVATVDAETGRMKCLAVGEATITAAAKNHPEITAAMTVTVTEFFGDWDRSGWRMKFSHGYKTDDSIGSSETAAIDGNEDTTLSMDRPGRVSSIPATAEIWFQIDRGNDDPGMVDYLRIRHRPRGNNNENILVRWFGFNRIEGSRDGEHFEVLAERVALTPDPNVYNNLLTDDIAIPENDYRYLRFIGWNDVSTVTPFLGFYCARGTANGGTNPGGTIQINEFYLGRTKK